VLFEASNPRHAHEWMVFRDRAQDIPRIGSSCRASSTRRRISWSIPKLLRNVSSASLLCSQRIASSLAPIPPPGEPLEVLRTPRMASWARWRVDESGNEGSWGSRSWFSGYRRINWTRPRFCLCGRFRRARTRVRTEGSFRRLRPCRSPRRCRCAARTLSYAWRGDTEDAGRQAIILEQARKPGFNFEKFEAASAAFVRARV
jgi:hypothetical protein